MLTREKLIQILSEGGCYLKHDLYTDESGLAHLMDCKVRTVRNWRAAGTAPRSHHSTRVLFEVDEIVAWYNGRSVKGEVEKAGHF